MVKLVFTLKQEYLVQCCHVHYQTIPALCAWFYFIFDNWIYLRPTAEPHKAFTSILYIYNIVKLIKNKINVGSTKNSLLKILLMLIDAGANKLNKIKRSGRNRLLSRIRILPQNFLVQFFTSVCQCTSNPWHIIESTPLSPPLLWPLLRLETVV